MYISKFIYVDIRPIRHCHCTRKIFLESYAVFSQQSRTRTRPPSDFSMVPSIYFVITFLVVSSVSSKYLISDTKKYVHLIMDLQEFHRISSAVIVYDGEGNDLFVLDLLKRLSEIQHYSIALKRSDFSAKFPIMAKRSRLLFMVLLESDDDLEKFVDFTRNRFMTYHVWLVIFYPSMSQWMREFCQNPMGNSLGLNYGVNMLIKCGDDPEIKEWFATGIMNDVQVREYLEWSPETRLVVKKSPILFERRRNLNGVTLKAAVVQDMSYPVESHFKNGYGYELVPKIMNELALVMNITIKYKHASTSYGIYNQYEKKWTGILGRLWNNTIDIAATELIVTDDRISCFDFTIPIVVSMTRLFIKKPNNTDVSSKVYIKTFSAKVWFALITIIIFAMIVLTIINCTLNSDIYFSNCILDSCMHVWSIFCQQGLPDFSDNRPLNLAYLSLFITAFTLTSIYSGSLTSYMTVSMPIMPFNNLIEFIEDGTYELIVIKNSAELDTFLKPSDEIIYNMAKMLKNEDELPANYIMGFEQMCEDNNKVAFFASEVMLNKIYREPPCEISSITAGTIRYKGIGLNKFHPLTDFFNYYIQKFMENGIMSQIKLNYEKKITNNKPLFEAFEVHDIISPLIVLSLGFGFSFLLLMIECFANRLYDINKTIRLASRWIVEKY